MDAHTIIKHALSTEKAIRLMENKLIFVVERTANKLEIKKGGHGGTLDVAASGLLIVGLKFSTKLLEYVLGQDKVYVAEITFGLSSDTLDLDGTIINNIPSSPKIEDIEETLKNFVGTIEQVPPIFSALKLNGQSLYKLARAGKTADLEKKRRKINIYSIKTLNYEVLEQSKLTIEVHCGSGTYIRSLARDIGESLNSPAILSSLIRTKIGDFSLTESVDIENILPSNIIQPESFLERLSFKKQILNDNEKTKFLNGNFIQTKDFETNKIFIMDEENNFLGNGRITNKGVLKPVKVCKLVV
jgi:tRNA pseudouridine55 synthase